MSDPLTPSVAVPLSVVALRSVAAAASGDPLLSVTVTVSLSHAAKPPTATSPAASPRATPRIFSFQPTTVRILDMSYILPSGAPVRSASPVVPEAALSRTPERC